METFYNQKESLSRIRIYYTQYKTLSKSTTHNLQAAPKIKTEIKDVAVTCNNPLAHMGSHTTAAVLQELYSLLVIPAVEHANEAT